MKSGHKLPLKDAWAIWFLLGVVMLNYPFLHIFNKNVMVLGFPLTFLYFFIGWPASIFVIYLFSIYIGQINNEDPEQDNDDQSPWGAR